MLLLVSILLARFGQVDVPTRDMVSAAIARMNDSKREPRQREDDYLWLARTGTEAGIAAVLSSQLKPGPLPSLEKRMDLENLSQKGHPSKLLRQYKDRQNRTWGLISSDVLGNNTDLWIAEDLNGRWVNPVFTGDSMGLGSLGINRSAPIEVKANDERVSKLLDGGWIQRFVGNQDLYRSTTPCGLTDVEKKRLGLDPSKPDTNGDGIPDGLDPSPSVKPRKLTDAEQVISAAYEAMFHFYRRSTVMLIETIRKDIHPFQLAEEPGPAVWITPSIPDTQIIELLGCEGRGVYIFRLNDNVSFNPSRTEATIEVAARMTGASWGCKYKVRKIGSHWLVIEKVSGWMA